MIEMHCPTTLPTSLLIQEARQEIELFIRHAPDATTLYSYELFRRALVLQDDYAWTGLYELYRYVVGTWIIRTTNSGVIANDVHESLVNFAFAKFSKSVSPAKFEDFNGSVPSLLAYLKRCAATVTIDHLRSTKSQMQVECLDIVAHDVVCDDTLDSVIERLAAQEVWQIVREATESEAERFVLLFVCTLGWPPRDLQLQHPQLFHTIEDVYRCRRNVTERLRRNRKLQGMLNQHQKARSA